jgi:hypothetical protein
MNVRVIYADLSEWIGDSADWGVSPDRGILIVEVYLNPPYRIRLEGADDYGMKETAGSLMLGLRTLDESAPAWIYHIDKATRRDLINPTCNDSYPQCLINRVGVDVSNDIYSAAQVRASTWEHLG